MEHTPTQSMAPYQADLEQLRAQRAELQAQLTELDRLVVAAELLLAWQTGAPLPSSAQQASLPIIPTRPLGGGQAVERRPTPPSYQLARRLQGLTHNEALMLIAKENGGTIRPADAKDILIAAGLTKGKPRNVATHVYHLLSRSEQFEHVSPGTFRLVEWPDDESGTLGTPASAPHPPGIDFITVESPQRDRHEDD